jgi:hypothetical protein
MSTREDIHRYDQMLGASENEIAMTVSFLKNVLLIGIFPSSGASLATCGTEDESIVTGSELKSQYPYVISFLVGLHSPFPLIPKAFAGTSFAGARCNLHICPRWHNS